jgi:predicted RNase H-like HicB family nuclease
MGPTVELVYMGTGRASPLDANVTVTRSDGLFVVTDVETGVTSQGVTKSEAVANLAEALRLYERPAPEVDDVEEESTAPWL